MIRNSFNLRKLIIKLYFSPLGIIVHYITKLMALMGVKCIVYGYRKNKKFLMRTRIASTSIITGKRKLILNDNVWINHYSRVDASGGVVIGEGCQIGFGSCILSHSSHISIRLLGRIYMELPINERIGYIHKPTKIGEYTFIGGGSFIMPGVNIGKGCVIGVNSVITHDIPNYSVVVGSPGRIIGSTKEQDKPYEENDLVKSTYYEFHK